jgi:hypothetical protein
LMVSNTASLVVAPVHVPCVPVTVIVSVTVPAVISAALGVYVAVADVAFGVYVPAPPDHNTVPFEAEPCKACELTAQSVASDPAFAVGTCAGLLLIVSTTASLVVAPVHVPCVPVTVIVSVTVPAVISAALGVYVAVADVAFGVYVPVPPDHATVPFEAEPCKACELTAQSVASDPAFAVGVIVLFMVITTWSVTTPHGPAGSLVDKVKVTVPAVISAALGV